MRGCGATAGEWDQLIACDLIAHQILPVVSDPDIPPLPGSSVTADQRGKIPSTTIERDGRLLAMGVRAAKAGKVSPFDGQLESWRKETAAGSGDWRGAYLRTGHNGVIAVDADLDDEDRAREVRQWLEGLLGITDGRLSCRTRAGSPRWAVLLRVSDGPAIAGKCVIRAPATESGSAGKQQAVEILGSGQGLALFGRHPSGLRYEWEETLKVYDITRDRLESFVELCRSEWAPQLSDSDQAINSGSAGRLQWMQSETDAVLRLGGVPCASRAEILAAQESDPFLQLLRRRGWQTYGGTTDGGIKIRCPNEAEHTKKTGDGEAVYWSPGTPGHEAGGFKCLHAHCEHINRVGMMQMISHMDGFRDEPAELFLPAVSDGRGGLVMADFPDESAGAKEAQEQADQKISNVQDLRDDERPPVRLTGAEWLADTPEMLDQMERDNSEDLSTALLAMSPFRKRGKNEPEGAPPRFESDAQSLRAAASWTALTGYQMRLDTWLQRFVARKAGGRRWEVMHDEWYSDAQANLAEHGFIRPTEAMVTKMMNLRGRLKKFDSLSWFIRRNVPRWDGTPRIARFFQTYCHCRETRAHTAEYYRAVAEYWWRALFMRAINAEVPIREGQDMLVLIGGQGVGKSWLASQFTLRAEDFTEGVSFDMRNEEFMIALQGKLVAEIAERAGYGRKSNNDIKRVLSTTTDTYRPKYGRSPEDYIRRTLFVMTTNDMEVNSDLTGERRKLPVEIPERVEREMFLRDRLQLWAEAMHQCACTGGYVPQMEAEAAAAPLQDDYAVEDPIAEEIAAFAASCDKIGRAFVIADVVRECPGCATLNNHAGSCRISAILRNQLGYERTKQRLGESSRPVNVWIKKSDA